jgi:hydrogenase-4 component B
MTAGSRRLQLRRHACAGTLAGIWASAAFLLALFGFGAKAGLLPVHVWLPEAHPAAPSPVSAMMSGVMLKTAIYGLLRVSFDLLHTPIWWWGVVALVVGLAPRSSACSTAPCRAT